jgi:hypothetical protein
MDEDGESQIGHVPYSTSKPTPKPQPPIQLRDPVQTTAAYLVAYLGSIPRSQKERLMEVAEAFMPYLNPNREADETAMSEAVEQRIADMERVLKLFYDLRDVAENYGVLTVDDVIG